MNIIRRIKKIVVCFTVVAAYLFSVTMADASAYPMLVSTLEFKVSGESFRAPTLREIRIVGRYAYIISDRVDPISQSASDVSQSGYSRHINRPLLVADIVDPINPVFVGYGPPVFAEYPFGFTIAGRYAYVGSPCCLGSLIVFDIKNPLLIPPAIFNSVGTYNVTSLSTDGELIFASSGRTLKVVSVTNPQAPLVLATLDLVGQNTVASGNYLYTKEWITNKFIVIDKSVATAPRIVSTITTDKSGTSQLYNTIALSEPYIYTVNREAKTFQVIDVSSPEIPQAIGRLTFEGNPTSVFAISKYVYVLTDTPYELVVIDVQIPTDPKIVSTAVIARGGLITDSTQSTKDIIPSTPASLYVSDSYAYVTNAAGFMEVFYLGEYSDYVNSLTIDFPVKKTDRKTNYKVINFTAKTTMPRRQPGASDDNLAQVKLKNGQVIPLEYDRVEGGYTMWKGTFKQTTGTINSTHISISGSFEQVASNTFGPDQTHFSALPSDFTNDGVTINFEVIDATASTYTIKNAAGEKSDIVITESSADEKVAEQLMSLLSKILSLLRKILRAFIIL